MFAAPCVPVGVGGALGKGEMSVAFGEVVLFDPGSGSTKVFGVTLVPFSPNGTADSPGPPGHLPDSTLMSSNLKETTQSILGNETVNYID
jgi:hypothetical protein